MQSFLDSLDALLQKGEATPLTFQHIIARVWEENWTAWEVSLALSWARNTKLSGGTEHWEYMVWESQVEALRILQRAHNRFTNMRVQSLFETKGDMF